MAVTVATDLVAPRVQVHNRVGTDHLPVIVLGPQHAARDIEGGAGAMFFQKAGASRGSGNRHIVEGETDGGRVRGRVEGRHRQMRGQLVMQTRHQARAVPRVVRRRHWTEDRADHFRTSEDRPKPRAARG